MKTFLRPLWLIAALASLSSPATAQVLFRDDFDGTSLDTTKWFVADWALGRTQFGNAPVIANGIARLKFETFDPRHPGRRFYGTEIDSNQTFPIGNGIEFEARVRVNVLPPGLVTSLFTYTEWQTGAEDFSDEIDFEFLSKQTRNQPHTSTPIQLTTYRDFNNTHPDYDDENQTSSEDVRVTGLELTQFNTLVIRWLPARVEWLVNGKLVRTVATAVPQQAMNICLNFWAPARTWPEAFFKALVPASSRRRNQVYYYDVDYVEVRNIPRP